jgi:hypothetical protein
VLPVPPVLPVVDPVVCPAVELGAVPVGADSAGVDDGVVEAGAGEDGAGAAGWLTGLTLVGRGAGRRLRRLEAAAIATNVRLQGLPARRARALRAWCSTTHRLELL